VSPSYADWLTDLRRLGVEIHANTASRWRNGRNPGPDRAQFVAWAKERRIEFVIGEGGVRVRKPYE